VREKTEFDLDQKSEPKIAIQPRRFYKCVIFRRKVASDDPDQISRYSVEHEG